MQTLTDWLLAMMQPMIVRMMMSLGLSVTTIKGVDTAFEQTRGYIQSAVNSMPAAVLQLAGLFGVDTALSWILGAMAFALSLYAMKSFFGFFGLSGPGGTSS